ncbi:MAG: pyridine nucleotide-disulfide oxidoreductase [Burkholderiales bacterium]|nr:MAG: pyridine nucleotide-disulfide oxidoreductase [Burkholderiales bacterium]
MKKLLLLGAGHAHVHVLSRLAQHHPADLDVTVLTPYDFQTYSGMTPGFVAGHYTETDCQIPLAPLIRAAGARWVAGRCIGLDAQARKVRVGTHPNQTGTPSVLTYDLLSVDTGAVIDRERLEEEMPGAAQHALMVRPIEAFARLWPDVVALARRQSVSVAVIGAGAAGIELLLAICHRLQAKGMPVSRFTLLTGGGAVGANYPPGVQRRILRQLRKRGVTVLNDACVGVEPGRLHLGSGATLACDVPVLAIGTHAPPWLRGSGLELSGSGHLLVNAFQQSTSHPEVFAAGDVCTRADRPHPKSGVYAVRAGPALATNLFAAHEGQALTPHHPPERTLNLLSCGTGHAIASWGPLHAEGGWAWRWKDRIDRAFMARYTLAPA